MKNFCRKKKKKPKKLKVSAPLLDNQILDQVQQEEAAEKAAENKKENFTIQPTKSVFEPKVSKPISKKFDDFKIHVKAIQRVDILSQSTTIDSKVIDFLQEHFYGNRIKRQNSATWFSSRRAKHGEPLPSIDFENTRKAQLGIKCLVPSYHPVVPTATHSDWK